MFSSLFDGSDKNPVGSATLEETPADGKTVRRPASRKRMPHPAVDEGVKRHARRAAIWAGRGIFKGTALIAAFALIVAVWFWDAALLTETADRNLSIIKTVTGLLPGDWSSRVESALRMFGADRALLLTEAVLLAKLVMVMAGYPFVLAGRGIRTRLHRRRTAPEPPVLATDRQSSLDCCRSGISDVSIPDSHVSTGKAQ
jgi:hypothetical protein